MSKAFKIYFETKDIIETNTAEDNITIFTDILSALREDLQSGTLQQQYSYTERDLDTFEEVVVTINTQELLEEILDLFSSNTTPYRFSNLIHNLITSLESINHSDARPLLAVLNEYTYNPDTELQFPLDEHVEEQIVPILSNYNSVHTASSDEDISPLRLNNTYKKIRDISIANHRSTEQFSVSWEKSGECIFGVKFTGQTPPYDDHSGGGIY